jgi:septum formation protein
MRLILASGSPRRADILRAAGFSIDIYAPDIAEVRRRDELAGDYVRRLAEEKARAVAKRIGNSHVDSGAIIIAADTTVVVAGSILEKPADITEANAMIEKLSGRMHEIHTGVALLQLPDERMQVFEEVTRVDFARLSPEEIADYVASGESLDKAGAYAIQGRGGKFVTRIDGCYFNVMGLPLGRIYQELRALGWSPDEFKTKTNTSSV